MINLASYLDFANHHANATHTDIQTLCRKVIKHHFHSAFTNPYYVSFARPLLPSPHKIGTVISFPLGQETLDIKLATARHALTAGADELDISLNVGLIKQAKWSELLDEMRALVTITKEKSKGKIIKFILETGYLTESEIKKGSTLILESGADFIKTCSGMGPRGSTLEDVHLIKQAIGNQIKIKVAGGISTYHQALTFIQAGASRIGTSHAPEILAQSNNSVSG
jgi:deoxyribose-phosphate aldolase